MARGYLIGDGFRERIERTIERVNAAPYGGGVTSVTPRLETPPQLQKAFRICTFTGAWSVGSQNTLTFRGVTTTPNTVSATNLFFNLPNNGTSTCAIAKDGTAWYLVQDVHTQVTVITNVSLGTAGLEFTRAVLTVVATATASVTNIGTTACA